jgi:hypothetical protein
MKDKTTAILLGLLFIPLGFLYTYKKNVGEFWFSLIVYGSFLFMTIYFNMGLFYYGCYILLHLISVYRLFGIEDNSFYTYYPNKEWGVNT